MSALKKALSCALCAALLLSGPGVSGFEFFCATVFAEDGAPQQPALSEAQTQERLAYLREIGYLQGDNDPLLRIFLGPGRRGTQDLDRIYQYYSLGTNAQGRSAMSPEHRTLLLQQARDLVQEHQESVLNPLRERIREAKDSEIQERYRTSQVAVQNVQNNFGTALQMHSNSQGGAYLGISAQLNAIYAGQLAHPRPFDPNLYARHETADGHVVFYDDKGHKALEVDKTGNDRYYDIAIAREQARMRDFPDISVAGCAAPIDISGRWDYPTLHYQACLREGQIKALERQVLTLRVQFAAMLLNKQLKPEIFSGSDAASEARLKRLDEEYSAELIRHGFAYGDRFSWVPILNRLPIPKSVAERIGPKFEGMLKSIKDAQDAMALYRHSVDQIRQEQLQGLLPPDRVNALQTYNRQVNRYIQMAQMDAILLQVALQAESMGWEIKDDNAENPQRVSLQRLRNAPDAEQFRRAVERVARTDEEALRYLERPELLANRYHRLWILVRQMQNGLKNAAIDSDLADLTPLMIAADQERRTLGMVYSGLSQVPQLFNIMDTEGQGFLEGLKRTGSNLLGTAVWLGTFGAVDIHGGVRDRVGGNLNPGMTYAEASVLNWVSQRFGGDWHRDYFRRREQMESYRPQMRQVFETYRDGDLEGATRQIALIDRNWNGLEAWQTHQFGLLGKNPSEVSLYDKSMAVLQKAQEIANSVMQSHLYTSVLNDMLVWSTVLSVTAPFAAARLSQIANKAHGLAAAAEGLKEAQGAMRALKFLRAPGRFVGNLISETTGNMARHLERLSAASGMLKSKSWLGQTAENTAVRFVNASGKIWGFALGLAGPLGMLQTLVMHYGGLWKFVRGNWSTDESQFTDAGDALLKGFFYSAQWAVGGSRYGTFPQWWVPLILFGLQVPAEAYEGTRVGALTSSLANRGLVGNAAAASRWGLNRLGLNSFSKWWADKLNMENWMLSAGKWGRSGLGLVATLDQVLKFQMIGLATDFFSMHLGFLFSSEPDFDRRVRLAHNTGRYWQEAPLWLLIPMPAAPREEGAGLNPLFVKSGVDWLTSTKGGSRRLDIANANPAETPNPTKFHVPTDIYKEPLWQRIMNFRIRGPRSADEISIPERMIETEIRKLLQEFTGGDPFKLRDIANHEGGTYRGLRLRETTRELARKMAEDAFARNAELANKILRGQHVDGIGIPSSELKSDVASALIRAERRGKAVDGKSLRISKENMDLARQVLRYEWEAEGVGMEGARRYYAVYDAIYGDESYQLSSRGQDVNDAVTERLKEWANNQKNKGHSDSQKSFEDLLAELDGMIPRDLPARETELLRAGLEFLRGIDTEFNYVNHHAPFLERFMESLDSHFRNYEGDSRSDAAKRFLDPNNNNTGPDRGLLQMVRDWLGDPANGRTAPDALVVRHRGSEPHANSFGALLESVGAKIKDIKRAGNLSAKDKDALDHAYVLLKKAPWLRRDAKGDPLPGWRPEQAISVMDTLRVLNEGGSRIFTELGTGGGKTLFQFVFLLRFAEAEASAAGQDVIIINPNSTLDLQDQAYMRALKLVRSKVEFDTFDHFKFRVAEERLKGHDLMKKKRPIFAEMDSLGAQPASTIGSGFSGSDPRNPALIRVRENNQRMRNPLDRELRLQQRMSLDVLERLRMEELKLEDSPLRTRLDANYRELRQAMEDIYLAQSRSEFSPDRAAALDRAKAAVERYRTQSHRAEQSGDPALAQSVRDLRAAADALRTAPGEGAEAVREVDARIQQVEIASARARFRSLVAELEGLLSSPDVAAFASVNAQIQSLETEAGSLAGADPASLGASLARGGSLNGIFRDLQVLVDQAPLRNSVQGRSLRSQWESARAQAQRMYDQLYGTRREYRRTQQNGQIQKTPVDERGMALELEALEAEYRQAGLANDPARREALNRRIQEMIAPSGKTMRRGKLLERTPFDALIEYAGGTSHAADRLHTAANELRDAAGQATYADPTAENPTLRNSVATNEIDRVLTLLGELRARIGVEFRDALVGRLQQLAESSRTTFEPSSPALETKAEILRLGREARDAVKQGESRVPDGLRTLRADFATLLAEQEAVAGQNPLPEGNPTDGLAARQELAENSSLILEALRYGTAEAVLRRVKVTGRTPKEGWQAEVRRLLARREQILERSMTRRNEMYEVFHEADARMGGNDYGFYAHEGHSYPGKAQAMYEADVVELPAQLQSAMEGKAQGMVDAVERAAGNPHAPQVQLARFEQRLFAAKARSAGKVLGRTARESNPASLGLKQRLLTALMDARAEANSAKADLESAKRKDPALEQAVRDTESQVRQLEAQLDRLERSTGLAELQQERLELLTRYRATVQDYDQAAQDVNRDPLSPQARARLAAAREAHDAAAWDLGVLDILIRADASGTYQSLKQRRNILRVMQETAEAELAVLRRSGGSADEIERLEERIHQMGSEINDIHGRLAPYEAPVVRDVVLAAQREAGHMVGNLGAHAPPKAQFDPSLAAPFLQRLHNTPTQARAEYAKWLEGMAREYGPRLESAFRWDRWLPEEVRLDMYWNIHAPISNLMLRLLGKTTWVENLLLDFARGYRAESGNYRYDGHLKRMIVVHNGEFAPTMVDHNLMHFALQRRAYMPFPIREKIIVTLPQWVEDHKDISMFGTSGTIADVLRKYLAKSGDFRFAGSGSKGEKPKEADIALTREQHLANIGRMVREAVGDPDHRSVVYQSVANNREWKAVRRYLLRERILSEGQIATIFSDMLYLERLHPEARIDEQANLERLRTGEIRLVLVVGSVGGRGKDFSWKGGDKWQGAGKDVGDFPGYNHIIVSVQDPFKISWEEEVQNQGRSSSGRTLEGAGDPSFRRFIRRTMDIREASTHTAFLQMMSRNQTFRGLADNPPPELARIARANGHSRPDWPDIHAYIMSLPATDPVRVRYFAGIGDAISARQAQVARRQFQSSYVLTGTAE